MANPTLASTPDNAATDTIPLTNGGVSLSVRLPTHIDEMPPVDRDATYFKNIAPSPEVATSAARSMLSSGTSAYYLFDDEDGDYLRDGMGVIRALNDLNEPKGPPTASRFPINSGCYARILLWVRGIPETSLYPQQVKAVIAMQEAEDSDSEDSDDDNAEDSDSEDSDDDFADENGEVDPEAGLEQEALQQGHQGANEGAGEEI